MRAQPGVTRITSVLNWHCGRTAKTCPRNDDDALLGRPCRFVPRQAGYGFSHATRVSDSSYDRLHHAVVGGKPHNRGCLRKPFTHGYNATVSIEGHNWWNEGRSSGIFSGTRRGCRVVQPCRNPHEHWQKMVRPALFPTEVTLVTGIRDSRYGMGSAHYGLVTCSCGPSTGSPSNMLLSQWSKSEVEYGRRVLNSGLEGVRSGRETFLHGRPVTPFFRESFRTALRPAALGACVGLLATCPRSRQRSVAQTLAAGLLGGLIGLAAGIVWENRSLAASAVSNALKNIEKVRTEHWLEKHPIDYA